MFDHFTFGACAQTVHAQTEDIPASPTNTSFPSPMSASAPVFFDDYSPLDAIVDAFAQSSLRLDENEEPQRSAWVNHLPSPSFSSNDDSEFTIEELSYVSTRRNMAKVVLTQVDSTVNVNRMMEPRNGTVASRRARKTMDTKVLSLCCHGRDIDALVEDMIVTGEQCTLHSSTQQNACPPTSQSTQPLPDELIVDTTEINAQIDDEGFGEMEEATSDLLDMEIFNIERLEKDDDMTLRRASTPSGIRKGLGKYNVVKWRKSGDIVGSGPGLTSTGRAKVRCVPRMRRRTNRNVPV